MSPLRWTSKSIRTLTAALREKGHQVSDFVVRRLLNERGYSLQANVKTAEGGQHPDRDAQFAYLNDQASDHLATGDPVISVDTKKKELVGAYKNGGREWHPTGQPGHGQGPRLHRPRPGQGQPLRGVRRGANTGWVSVGTDHDTAAFAVNTIAHLVAAGRKHPVPERFPAADLRRRRRLQRLPHPAVEDRTRRPRRRHRPDDHRLPPAARHHQVEQDRAPAVLPHLDELARQAADQPRGHRPDHRRDHHQHRADRPRRTRHATYPNGIKIPDRQMKDLDTTGILTRHDFHGEWNYTLHPPTTTRRAS